MPLTTPLMRNFVRSVSGSPNRSEFSAAIGRAPIVKMSRRIPPTPVAAPWNGSTALGWLCDSILNAMPYPSPMSITPAFSSPAATSIRPPERGKVLSCRMEFLYEQCSLHITEYMPSSVYDGVRPSRSHTRAYSCSVRPSSFAVSTVTLSSLYGSCSVMGW